MSSSVFCVISHEGVLERIHEVEIGKSMIGRGDHCVIWLPDPHVSREHAILNWTGKLAVILDLGSRNGTHVNGRRVQGEETLSAGSDVRIGPYILKVYFEIGAAIRNFVNAEISTRTDFNHDFGRKEQVLVERKLTPAQTRVYEAFIEGLTEKEVAGKLNLSIHTVHTHAKAIYKTFEISSRAELVRRWAAHQNGQ